MVENRKIKVNKVGGSACQIPVLIMKACVTEKSKVACFHCNLKSFIGSHLCFCISILFNFFVRHGSFVPLDIFVVSNTTMYIKIVTFLALENLKCQSCFMFSQRLSSFFLLWFFYFLRPVCVGIV